MNLNDIIAYLSMHYEENLDSFSSHRDNGNEPMAQYFEGITDGIKLALRYLEQLDKKETAAPASTAANPL